MTDKEAVKQLMKDMGWSQAKLASEAGYKYPTNVANMLNRHKGLRIDNMLKLIQTMGGQIVVRGADGTEYVVTHTEDEE